MTSHTDHDAQSSSQPPAQDAEGLPGTITPAIATRVLETIDHGLSYGLGKFEPGCMCLLEALCYAQGLPQGEHPEGVEDAPRSVALALNDSGWSSRMMRARGLRRLGLALLDTQDRVDVEAFAARIVGHAFRRVPAALRAVASIHVDATHQAALNSAAADIEQAATRESLLRAGQVIHEAVPQNDAELATAVRIAGMCVGEATRILDLSECKAVCLQAASTVIQAIEAEAAVACVLDATAEISTRDNGLAAFAETVVQILIELHPPGCQWLELAGASMKAVTQREIHKLSQTDADNAS